MIVGLNSGTNSKNIVLGGIITIAIADALSDALGIHISEENNETFEQTVEMLKKKYLAILYETSYSIIISNNNCKINGYRTKWQNVI